MLYAFYNHGRKPGGYQSWGLVGIDELRYDDEKVHAFELGAKSMLLDERLLLNFSAFLNAYDGLQANNLVDLGTQNIDAEVWGIELEARWRPSASLSLELAYGYLGTEIHDFRNLDEWDLTAGDPTLVELNDIDAPFFNFVAPRDQVLAITPQAISEGGAIAPPGTLYDDGIPTLFSRPYLEQEGIQTLDGVPVDLDGRRLPGSPKHSLSLALAYTWFSRVGSLTARWDFLWQGHMYTRMINRPGDRVDSWSQHNASLTYSDPIGRWNVSVWVRNIDDRDHVTNHYVNLPVGGGYRNVFLMEPRVYGATLRYEIGNR